MSLVCLSAPLNLTEKLKITKITYSVSSVSMAMNTNLNWISQPYLLKLVNYNVCRIS